MPKAKIDYSNSVIYKIVCNDVDITECYVGSTTNFLKRKYVHKYICNNQTSKNYNFYVYKFIRDNGGFDNWSMVIIEDYSCDNRLDLLKRERHFVENLKAKLNTRIPSRSKKEYFLENKEIIYQKNKQNYENNKEKKQLINKQYYLENKEKLQQQKKQYYLKNKQTIDKRNKQYCIENREKVLQRKKHYYNQTKNSNTK